MISIPSRINGSGPGSLCPQGKSSHIADGRLFYAWQGSTAAKNLTQQDRFLARGSIRIRGGIIWSRQPGLNRPSRVQD